MNLLLFESKSASLYSGDFLGEETSPLLLKFSGFKDLKSEASFCSLFDHPNVGKCKCGPSSKKKNQPIFLLAYHGNFDRTLSAVKATASGPQILRTQLPLIIAQMIAAILHVHSKGFIHLNLNLNSFALKSGPNIVVLIDLANLRGIGPVEPASIDLNHSSAPELYLAKSGIQTIITEAADWFSLGSIIYQLVRDESKEGNFPSHRIVYNRHIMKEVLEPELFELFSLLNDPNPSQRRFADTDSIIRLIRLPLLKSVNWTELLSESFISDLVKRSSLQKKRQKI